MGSPPVELKGERDSYVQQDSIFSRCVREANIYRGAMAEQFVGPVRRCREIERHEQEFQG